MTFEAYSVAVKLSLTGNLAASIIPIVGHFDQLNKRIENSKKKLSDFEVSLAKVQRMALGGGLLAGAGLFGLSMFRAPIEEAKLFQTEVAKFASLGLGDSVNSQAVQFAKGMDVMGQSARDNMVLLREATSIMGDFGHAKEIAPILARAKFGIESVMQGGHGGNFEQMFQAAIKTTELRGALVNRDTGAIDVQKFSGVMNMMVQAYVASGGLVKPQDYLAAIKTGGVSTKLMNDEMFFYGLGHFIQESGGSRTGTASMSLFQNWGMGRMSQQVAENLAKHGLLDPKALHYGKTGHITKVDPMGIIFPQEFIANPFKWVNERVVPMLQKQGYKGNDLNLMLSSMLGIRTASNLVDQFVREQKVADLYVERARRASGVDGLYALGSEGLQGKENDLNAKWSDVLNELGTVVLPVAIAGVKDLTILLRGVRDFTREFPLATKTIMIGVGALSTLALLGGSALLAASGIKAMGMALGAIGVAGEAGGLVGALGALIGPAGLAVAALTALAVAIGYFATKKSTDVDPHAGMHWVPGHGRSGAGGYWERNSRMVARGVWEGWDGSGWVPQDVSSGAGRGSVNPEFVRSGRAPVIENHTHVNLDGRPIAHHIEKIVGSNLSGPQRGTSRFDPRMSPMPVGGVGG